MKTCIVVYGSYYGSTQKYAEYIAKEIEVECYSYKEVSIEKLLSYDCIIFGGGLYAGGIHGSKVLRKHKQELEQKDIILFTVGMGDPKDENTIVKIKEDMDKAFTKSWANQMQVFHLRGALLYSKMNIKHRMLMNALVTMLKQKQETKNEPVVVTYGQDVDLLDVATAIPLISCASDLIGE